jgi:shikimate kinase
MKTVEITRHKQASVGAPVESTFKVFQDIYKREGLAGINKGVNAVAVRQATNWGSRMGFARLAESSLRKARGIKEGEKLGALDKILASTVGGALATWNQPIEVVRVEVSLIRTTNKMKLTSRCNPPSSPWTPMPLLKRLSSTPSTTFTRPTVSRVFTEVSLPVSVSVS